MKVLQVLTYSQNFVRGVGDGNQRLVHLMVAKHNPMDAVLQFCASMCTAPCCTKLYNLMLIFYTFSLSAADVM